MLSDAHRTVASARPRPVKWLGSFGVVLVLCGASLSLGSRIWFSTRVWSLLNVPIVLTPGHAGVSEFVPNVEADFTIRLAIDRQVPPSLADKVLGIGNPFSSSAEEVHGFKLTWTLRSDGKVVKTSTNDGRGQGYWGSTTGRILGAFHSEQGKQYQLNVDVLEDGSQLTPYHPHLKVSVDPFTLDGYAIRNGEMELAGYVTVGVGAVLLIAAAVIRWRKVTPLA